MTITRKNNREPVGQRVAAVKPAPVAPATVATTDAWRIVSRHSDATERTVYDIHREGENPDCGFASQELAEAYAVEHYGAAG